MDWEILGSTATVAGLVYAYLRNFKVDILKRFDEIDSEIEDVKTEIKEIRKDIGKLEVQIGKLETRVEERTLRVVHNVKADGKDIPA